MSEGLVGLDPVAAREFADALTALAARLCFDRRATVATAGDLWLMATAGDALAPSFTAADRAEETSALLVERAAEIEAATAAADLREHPSQFVDSMEFFLTGWSAATEWYDTAGDQPVDPTRYALLGAWRALLADGIDDGHLVVMGDRVNGVTGSYLVPSMAVGDDDSLSVGYALVDVEPHRSFDWTDAGDLALEAATVTAAGVCGVTMGAGCVVAGALATAGTAVTAIRLAQSCLAADRSGCLPALQDSAIDRMAPPGLLLLAGASSALGDREARRVRELAAGAVAHELDPGADGTVLEETEEVTITLRYATSVTLTP